MKDNENDNLQYAQTQYIPIICPICGSFEIAFVAEYHKCIWLRIIKAIIAALFIVALIKSITNYLNPNTNEIITPFLYGLAIAFVLVSIIISSIESRTHTKAICRNCGNIWLQE